VLDVLLWLLVAVALGVDVVEWWRGGGGVKEKVDDLEKDTVVV
jgi:hypothetical protein